MREGLWGSTAERTAVIYALTDPRSRDDGSSEPFRDRREALARVLASRADR